LEKTKLALNIVTDVELIYAKDVSIEALKFGAESIWIGETENLPHPFGYLSYIAKYVKAHLGTSIISAYLNPVDYVAKFVNEIIECRNVPKFTVGVGIGDLEYLRKKGIIVKRPLRFMKNYVSNIKNKLRAKALVTIGTAGRKMAKLSCEMCGTVMLNLVFPEYIKFVKESISSSCNITIIGPSLIRENTNDNSRLIRALRIASSIVLKGMNRHFLEEFELVEVANEIKRILLHKEYWKLKRYDKLLLEKFSIYGTLDEIEHLVEELSKLNVKRIIFGPPLYRRIDLVRKLFSNLAR